MKIELIDVTVHDLDAGNNDGGGKTVKTNCQMLCRKCSRKKSAK